MYVPLLALLLMAVIEWVIFSHFFFGLRKVLSWFVMLLLAVLVIWLVVGWYGRFWTDVIGLITLYRIFNLYRWGYSSLPVVRLFKEVRTTMFKLIVLQAIMSGLVWLSGQYHLLGHLSWYLLAIGQLVTSLVILIYTIRHFQTSRRINDIQALDDQHLPTLTVAIPARNETDSLNQCLMSLIACDYPKLEILVLDDQSTNRRTPEIIRAFAHDGVIFISGQEPPHGWLAKNFAYQQLLDAANGNIVLFCGADVRFDRQSLRFLIASLTNRHKTMESILPVNMYPSKSRERILQPLRYAWEICLPRRYVRQPPTLSTCWLASKSFLVSHGGFKAVTSSVIAEEYFARQATWHDGYSFFRYDGIGSAKSPDEQLETAIRVRYPQLHHRPEAVMTVTLIEICLFLATLPLLVVGLINAIWPVVICTVIATGIYAYSFSKVSDLTYRRKASGSLWLWPIAVGVDIWVMHLSMFRYEFGQIYWRGRLVDTRV